MTNTMVVISDWMIDLLNDWLIDRSIDFVNMNHRCIRIYTWSCQFKGDYVKLGQPVAYPTRLWSVRSGGGLFGQVLVYSARRLSVQLSRAENMTSDCDTSWPDSRATRLSGQHRVRNPLLPPPPHPQPPPPASTPPSTADSEHLSTYVRSRLQTVTVELICFFPMGCCETKYVF